MPRPLKVFRAVAGFHDVYVATTSRKAALEAWGAETDLFSAGMAEEVKDAKLMHEPLQHPGEVFRLSRGSKSEWSAATKKASVKKPERAKSTKALERAEAALDTLKRQHDRERSVIERDKLELAERQLAMDRRHRAQIVKAQKRLEQLRD